MPQLGMVELLLVLVVVFLIFGTSRLPSVARSLGQALSELRGGMHGSAGDEDGRGGPDSAPGPAGPARP
jgi:sec-independent protein translocase protein TatA